MASAMRRISSALKELDEISLEVSQMLPPARKHCCLSSIQAAKRSLQFVEDSLSYEHWVRPSRSRSPKRVSYGRLDKEKDVQPVDVV